MRLDIWQGRAESKMPPKKVAPNKAKKKNVERERPRMEIPLKFLKPLPEQTSIRLPHYSMERHHIALTVDYEPHNIILNNAVTNTTMDWHDKGHVILDMGDFEGARHCFVKAIEVALESHTIDYQRIAMAVKRLGSTWENQGLFGNAERMFCYAFLLDQNAVGPEHPTGAADLQNLYTCLMSMTHDKGNTLKPDRVNALLKAGVVEDMADKYRRNLRRLKNKEYKTGNMERQTKPQKEYLIELSRNAIETFLVEMRSLDNSPEPIRNLGIYYEISGAVVTLQRCVRNFKTKKIANKWKLVVKDLLDQGVPKEELPKFDPDALEDMIRKEREMEEAEYQRRRMMIMEEETEEEKELKAFKADMMQLTKELGTAHERFKKKKEEFLERIEVSSPSRKAQHDEHKVGHHRKRSSIGSNSSMVILQKKTMNNPPQDAVTDSSMGIFVSMHGKHNMMRYNDGTVVN